MHVPARFGGIEMPHGELPDSPEEEPDQFAPPPEPKLHLEVAEIPHAKQHTDDRHARAEASLAKTRDELIIQKLRQAEIQERRMFYGPLSKLTIRDRAIAIGVTALACAITTELWRPIVWGLFPIVVVLVVVTALGDRD